MGWYKTANSLDVMKAIYSPPNSMELCLIANRIAGIMTLKGCDG